MVSWSVPLLIVRGQPLSVSVDDGALSAAALSAVGGGSVRVMVRWASSLCAQEAATVSPVMIKLRSIRFIFLVSVPSITVLSKRNANAHPPKWPETRAEAQVRAGEAP